MMSKGTMQYYVYMMVGNIFSSLSIMMARSIIPRMITMRKWGMTMKKWHIYLRLESMIV